MIIAYFDCFSGISGDMTLGALVDLGLDPDFLKDELAKMKLEGYKISFDRTEKHGIAGTKVHVGLTHNADHDHHHSRNLNDIRQLMKAMDEKKICEIIYRKPWEDTSKTFYIKPYKLFSYNNALYLHAGMARYPGAKKTTFEFNPLLAVHRLEKVTVTERQFVFPSNYNFEKHFNQAFGIIKQETFKVRLELTGYAAAFAQERRLSPDQKIRKDKEGTLILSFTASSEPEVISWILSHGDEAKVLSPGWLVAKVKKTVEAISKQYK